MYSATPSVAYEVFGARVWSAATRSYRIDWQPLDRRLLSPCRLLLAVLGDATTSMPHRIESSNDAFARIMSSSIVRVLRAHCLPSASKQTSAMCHRRDSCKAVRSLT